MARDFALIACDNQGERSVQRSASQDTSLKSRAQPVNAV